MNIALYLIFIILLINLILQFKKIDPNRFNILYSKTNYLTFKTSIVNLLLILFLYLISAIEIRYEAFQYYILFPVFFILYIFFSLKYNVLKNNILINIALPYTFNYKFTIYYFTQIGLIFIVLLSLIFTIYQIKNKKLAKKNAIISILIFICLGFSNITITKINENIEYKKLEKERIFVESLKDNKVLYEQCLQSLQNQTINYYNKKNKKF